MPCVKCMWKYFLVTRRTPSSRSIYRNANRANSGCLQLSANHKPDPSFNLCQPLSHVLLLPTHKLFLYPISKAKLPFFQCIIVRRRRLSFRNIHVFIYSRIILCWIFFAKKVWFCDVRLVCCFCLANLRTDMTLAGTKYNIKQEAFTCKLWPLGRSWHRWTPLQWVGRKKRPGLQICSVLNSWDRYKYLF